MVGDLVPRAAPTRIRAAGVDRYKRLALGNDHTCGVLFLVSITRGTGPGSMLAP